REELIERDRFILRPEPAGRAEIGNATLGGNSGSRKRGDDARSLHEFLQLVDSGLQIRRDHVCFIRFGSTRCQEVTLWDICTPCCACATSIKRSTSTATSSGSKRRAAGSTRRTATRSFSWPRQRTKSWWKRASAPAVTPHWLN